jgi:hypothetical protein
MNYSIWLLHGFIVDSVVITRVFHICIERHYDNEKNFQILIDTVVNYSKQENYKLQPAKSAVMSFNTNLENPGYDHTINIISSPYVRIGIT